MSFLTNTVQTINRNIAFNMHFSHRILPSSLGFSSKSYRRSNLLHPEYLNRKELI